MCLSARKQRKFYILNMFFPFCKDQYSQSRGLLAAIVFDVLNIAAVRPCILSLSSLSHQLSRYVFQTTLMPSTMLLHILLYGCVYLEEAEA